MLNLTITTVDKQLFNGKVYLAIVPGSGGELTVLANHMPFITTLVAGSVRIKEKKESEEQTFLVERGLLEVSNNNAVILI